MQIVGVSGRFVPLRRRVVAVALSCTLLTAAVLGGLMLYLRFEAISSGENVLAGFAELANEQTALTMQDVEKTLQSAKLILSTEAGAGAENDNSIVPQLRALLGGRPFLSSVMVVSRQGRIVYGHDAVDQGRDVSDRDYFINQRANPLPGIMWGNPVIARSSGEAIITATVALRRPDGAFDGLVVGAVPLAFFDRIWKVDNRVEGLAIALTRDDGTLLVRSPMDASPIGALITDSALLSRLRAGKSKGSFEATNPADGVRTVAVFRRLDAYPALVLSLTRPLEEVLETWWRTVWIVSVGWIVAMATVAGLSFWVARELHARRRMEGRYRILFDSNPLPMLVADKATLRFVAVNDATVEQYGWSRQEMLTMKIGDMYLPEDVPGEMAVREQFVAGRVHVTALRHCRKDGSIVNVERDVRLIDFEGRPAFLAMMRDVTPSKTAQRHLAQLEDRYRGLLEAAPDAMVVVDQTGLIVLVNVQAEKQFGYRRDELLGQKVTNIIPEGFAERLLTDATRSETDALAQEIGTGIELSGRRKDGGEFPIEIMLSPLASVDGILVTAAIRNISVRKAAELHLTQMESRYRGLLEAAPDAMVVVNQAGVIVLVNVQAEKQFGYRRDELLGQKVTNIIPEGFAERLLTDATRSETDALAQEIGTGIELSGRRKDGGEFPIEIMLSPLASADGTLVTAAIRNISLRKGAEDLLRQSQKMEAVGQLTGGIAHDFNNILFVILANTDALLEDESFTPGVAERLGQIDKAVQRAADLTRQLLAFSRKQPLRPQRTDLNDLVTDTGKLLQRSLGAQIEIKAVLADDLCVVSVDRSQFETALVNLCLNARDAMPGGGRLLIETCNVTLDDEYCLYSPGAVPGEYAMLSVTDAGQGIPPDVLRRVFEPFFTTKEVGKGTGLGLSMVYGFIKQSNGHVGLYSELGHGTTVKLFLPRTSGPVEEVAVQGKTSMPGGAENILVVEDEPLVRANVVRQLRSLGYAVSEAADGAAGIAALEAASPAYRLMLTDVVMPGLLGGKLLAAEVARRWPEIKVVFMSGFTEISSVRHGRLDEGVTLLNKPFRKADLAQAIRLALDEPSAMKLDA